MVDHSARVATCMYSVKIKLTSSLTYAELSFGAAKAATFSFWSLSNVETSSGVESRLQNERLHPFNHKYIFSADLGDYAGVHD